MKIKLKLSSILPLIGVFIMLTGCTNHSVEIYKDAKPEVKFDDFFDGELVGWGIVQNWKGQVVRRFDIKMTGYWDGNKGKLEEDFFYYDGATQRRIWSVVKHDDGTFEGTADDILGQAKGTTSGNAINWHYSMDLPVGGKTYHVQFDDWMWQMNDGVLINRSYIKKFGITVAELTLFIQKVKAP